MRAPSRTASDFDSCRATSGRARSIAVLLLLGLTLALIAAPNASADTTHPFLGSITFPTGSENVQPVGVDDEGNLIVWLNDQRAVAKYDVDGDPVAFSALSTNL